MAYNVPGLQAVSKLNDYYQIAYDQIRIVGVPNNLLRSWGNIPSEVSSIQFVIGADFERLC